MSDTPIGISRADGSEVPDPDRVTVYDLVGGRPFFERLVDAFYVGVEADPPLRALYPDDLAPGKEHLALFLVQYWGGPGDYSERRGHPRLRRRHFPFSIGDAERNAWVRHMTDAVEATVPSVGLAPEVAEAVRQTLLDYFDGAATFLINVEG
jgi:hemoglobin